MVYHISPDGEVEKTGREKPYMSKGTTHNKKSLEYELVQNPRAKHIKISVGMGGRVTVTKPKRVSMRMVQSFLTEHETWIEEKVDAFLKAHGNNKNLLADDKEHFLKHKEEALKLCERKVKYWNRTNNFKYKGIKVKRLRTQWGSCSSEGNLSFNYKILFLPERMRNSIIVHELCHLNEMNHSKKFWELVEKTLKREGKKYVHTI